MNLLRYSFFILILIHIQSCASNKTTLEQTNVKSLTVSFYSPGNGINQEAKKAYDRFLAQNYSELEFETILWGREGEIDYCFQNIDLSKKNKKEFVQKTRELLSKYDRINIIENKVCKKGMSLPK